MAYNHRKAFNEFLAQQKKNEEAYRAAGMTDYQIREMYKFDLEVFRSDRRFYEHCSVGVGIGFEGSESYIHDHRMPDIPTAGDRRAHGKKEYRTFDESWLEEVSGAMKEEVLKMSKEDIYILGESLKGRSHAEIAEDLGICRQNVQRRYSKIKERLKQFLA
jgi:hypothetical protein